MSVYCLAGKIGIVDLSTGVIQIEDTRRWENGFLGGRGLNQHLLMSLEKDVTSPFEPHSVIVFGPGRLVGTAAPGAVRLNIDSRNVFTGGIGSSNLGGGFGAALKEAGFDHIAVKGKSEKPVYVLVGDGAIEIRDASALWGKVLHETAHSLRSRHGKGDLQFVGIGPAGESRVWTSAILDGASRTAGRCGVGAIMGGKKLKALVAAGSGKTRVKIANPEAFSEFTRALNRKLSSSVSVKTKKRSGTVAAIPPLGKSAAIPVRNFVDEYLTEKEMVPYSPENFDALLVRSIGACNPCPVRCQHLYQSTGKETWPQDKLEANTVWDFGPRLGLTNAGDILACHTLCTQYGLDIDSTASAICWAMDCYERGILTSSDVNGLTLQWGNAEVVFTLIKRIALREGFGDVLAEGSLRASRRIGKGSEALSYHIKGQDLIEPMRSCKGWALGVAVSPRGGTHTRGAPQTEFRGVDSRTGKRIWGVDTAGDPRAYEGKAQLVVYYERFHAVLDSLGLCYFVTNWSSPDLLGPEAVARLSSLALGEEITEEDLVKIGERILTLEKIYNILHTDFGREDDFPPGNFMKIGIKRGPFKGEKLEEDKWNEMLSQYYALHGWDPETSFPTAKTLRHLNLEVYSEMLRDVNKPVK